MQVVPVQIAEFLMESQIKETPKKENIKKETNCIFSKMLENEIKILGGKNYV